MIPVFEPEIGDEEIDSVVSALRRGEISGSFGTAITDFEEQFASFCGARFGIAMSSGTTALHAAVAACDFEPGSEVLVSASTNIATALAALHNNLVPVPVDSEPRTWNLDPALIEPLITERTRAILPVHLYGHPADMEAVSAVAVRHGLVVIEDCAESHGATAYGRMTGSFGDMACFSFYANKVITTGEGGMVVTSDEDLAERLRLLRNLAFGQPRFRHELAGFNFRMTGMQAALGLAQLAKIEQIIETKRQIASTYCELLADVSVLQLPVEESWARNVYWMFAVVVDPTFGVTRDELANRLRADGIDTRTFFCPMNLQPCLAHLPRATLPCPVAERLWRDGLYLPSSYSLDRATIGQVADAVRRALAA